MPTSYLHQLNEITEIITLLAPQSLLDIGPGFGKYGVLAREYLEFRDGRKKYTDWQRRIDALEIFPGYITPLHEFIYDHILIGDALEILPTLEGRYDLILLIDVIEHLPLEQGHQLLNQCQQSARNTLVSTPVEFFPQKGAFENPHEAHASFWPPDRFQVYSPRMFIPNAYSTICVIGEEAPRLHKALRMGRRELKRWFPFLFYLGQLARKLSRKYTP